MTAGECAETRISLGAYVLGALDPADRGRVDAHLATCAECREELASLAGLPGLLGRVSRADIEAEPMEPGPQLLERLLGAAAAERRHDRSRRWLTSAAAAVIAVAAVSVAVGVSHSGHHNTGAAAPVVPVGVSQTFTATNPQTHVQASVTEWKKGWGASLQVTVTGVTADLAGTKCQLIAVGPGGTTDIAASWAAPAAGYTGVTKVNADGATSLASMDITAFKVVGSDGATLVWVPAVWHT
jgi:predicted anti-sigma-YlaC factor YlaD